MGTPTISTPFNMLWNRSNKSPTISVLYDMVSVRFFNTSHSACVWLILTCKDHKGRYSELFPTCVFFSWNLSKDQLVHTNFTLLNQGSVRSGSTSWGNCGPAFSDELCVSLFSCLVIGSHTMLGKHSQPTLTLLGQRCIHAYLAATTCTLGRMTGIFYVLLW